MKKNSWALIGAMGIMLVIVLAFSSIDLKSTKRYYLKDVLRNAGNRDSLWSRSIKKYSLEFNHFRKQQGFPLLPDDFYLETQGGDFVEWWNPSPAPPALVKKIIVWESSGPWLLMENSEFAGP